MKNIKNLKNTILLSVFSVLLLFYILSFIPVFSREGYKKQKNSQESAFLNPDKVSEVSEISFGRGEDFLRMKKFSISEMNGNGEKNPKNEKEIWLGQKSFMNDYFLLDQEEITNILGKLKKIVRLYKISDNSSKVQDYGLDINQRLWVKYKISDKETEFFIGNLDSLKSSYYISFPDKKGIWKCQALLTGLEKMNLSSFISPLIIPQFDNFEIELLSYNENGKNQKHIIPSEKEEFKKLLSLRHGPLLEDENILNKIYDQKGKNTLSEELSIKINYPENFSIVLTFFEYNENTFLLNTQSDKINYTTSISRWTYENLLELLKSI